MVTSANIYKTLTHADLALSPRSRRDPGSHARGEIIGATHSGPGNISQICTTLLCGLPVPVQEAVQMIRVILQAGSRSHSYSIIRLLFAIRAWRLEAPDNNTALRRVTDEFSQPGNVQEPRP